MNFRASLVLLGILPPDPLDRRLVRFGSFNHLRLRDAHQGIGLVGVPGAGKTTAIRCILGAQLRAGFGGVALCVKPSAIVDYEEITTLAGRTDDVHVLNGTNSERFNPFDDLDNAADAAALLAEIATIASGMGNLHESNEAFWPIERNRLLLHLCEICRAHFGRIDAQLLTELLRSLPLTQADLNDPQWQSSSTTWAALCKTQNMTDSNIRAAWNYIQHEFCTQHHRMQGSILAMARSTLDRFLREPLASLFSGKSTVTMGDITQRGHIIIVGLPALSSIDGRIANAVIQYCFLRRAKATKSDADSFFLSDECQETATPELMSSLALLREHRVSCILATQSLGTLNLKLGKDAGEALIDLLRTLVFFAQSHQPTREWAANRIGKKQVTKKSYSSSDQGKSCTAHKEFVHKVPESEFQDLKPGHSICTAGKKHWRCRWPKNGISGLFCVRIAGDLSKGDPR